MKIAYFDCFSGISGDMILGALINCGVPIEYFKSNLQLLNINIGKIETLCEERNHIFGNKVIITPQDKNPNLRNLPSIKKILEDSQLDIKIKEQSIKIFEKLADVESKIHNVPIEKIHFHEVGAIDTLVDIIGTIIGLEFLKIEKIYCSAINIGTGFVQCEHTLPIPAPATLELLKNIPIYSTGVESELVTPTGAVIISSLSEKFGDLPKMKTEKIGYGIGEKKFKTHPNLLRIIIGELVENFEEDEITVIETNIDNLNPEIYDYLFEQLFQKGAKDVFITPIIMKKTRPANKLTILVEPFKKEEIISTIFKETSSIGLRIFNVKRYKLTREIKEIETPFGKVKVKFIGSKDEIYDVVPEYEDCKKIAQTKKMTLKEVMEKIKQYAGVVK